MTPALNILLAILLLTPLAVLRAADVAGDAILTNGHAPDSRYTSYVPRLVEELQKRFP